MPAALQITKKLAIASLIDIQDTVFADSYRNGLWWSLYGDYGGDKRVQDSYLDARHAYRVAQSEYFYYAATDSRILTDSELIKVLYESAQGHLCYPDEPDSWFYSIGCLLGSLSVTLFPATSQEWQQWEAEHRTFQAKLHRDTQPLDPLAVVA